MRLWLALGALAIVAFVVWQVISATTGGQTTSPYTTQQAEKGTLAVTVDGSGYLYAWATANVSPKVSGTVSGLHVGVGRAVQEGDVLFYVENEDLDTAVTKALASYRSSKQQEEQSERQLLQAQQQLDRLQNPSDTSSRTAAPSDEDIEMAEEDVEAAEEGLAAARANRDAQYDAYEQAIEDQDSREVVAPMDGVITAVNVASGDSVSAGTGSSAGGGGTSTGGTGATGGNSTTGSSSSNGTASSSGTGASSSAPIVITDVHSLYAKMSVSEVDITSVKRRQKVRLTFDALPKLNVTGKVIRIDPSGANSQGVVTFDVSIAFDLQDKRLRPGMSTSASIVTAVAQDAVLVPSAAVETTNGASSVRVVDSPQAMTARTVSVTTGLSNDTMIQIRSGLKGGQYVVTGERVDQSTSGSSGSGFGMPGMGGGNRSGGSSSGRSTGGQSGGGTQGPPPGM